MSTVGDIITWVWFDDTKGRSLVDKLTFAALRYAHKFGELPTHCYIHPSMFSGADMAPPSAKEGARPEIKILADRRVMPNNFALFVIKPNLPEVE